MPKSVILGVQTDAQRFDEAVTRLIAAASESRTQYVSTCPVYTLMMCRENPAVMAAVNGAGMVTADGMPVVWVQRQRGNPQAERVYGPDLLQAICQRTANTSIRHYFWGGAPGVPEQLATRLQTLYPGLNIAGTYSPPIEPVPAQPDPQVIERLNTAQPHIIWVGLGSPKQDLWMARYQTVLNAPLLIGVGAAFDMLAGTRKQAPRWMQRTGLEWVFRLMQEPRRLFKRYLVYNPLFIWHLWRENQSLARETQR
jgi:N-acetylglucosaminyldiphosphoundecaprenol N-acetyl-beta-D-mannosaminyltransferase